MVYGIAKMLNFAHGDVIMIGCYIVFVLMGSFHLNSTVSIIVAIIGCTILGVVIEKIAYKPLRKASPLAVLITAIGVSYFLQNLALILFGADTKSFTSVVHIPSIKLAGGDLTISGVTIATVISCIVIMAALMIFIKKSKSGQAMLAVSEDCLLYTSSVKHTWNILPFPLESTSGADADGVIWNILSEAVLPATAIHGAVVVVPTNICMPQSFNVL